MDQLANRAQHHLQMVLSEWYAWLGRRALRKLDWMETPWWAKQMPGRLDIPWALKDLSKYKDNEAMLRLLHIAVDEAFLTSKGLDGLPDMTKLHETVTKLYESSK